MKSTARERDVLRAVMAVCAAHGVDIRRQNTGAMRNASGRFVRFGRPGTPDLAGVVGVGPRRGIAIYIETKRPGGRPTPCQVGRMRELNASGAVAFWVDDAIQCARVLQRVVRDGCRVEVHTDGSQEIVDDA